MLFEEFQDCYHGHHLGYWNWMIQQLWISISPQCLPSSFVSTWHLKNFKMAILSAILDIKTEWFQQFCISVSLWCLPSSFSSMDLGFKRCHLKNGGHLRYWNRTILAILNLCVTVMPPIKFQLNQGLGGDVIWRISRWLPWWPSWIWERNDFSKFEFLCHCDASHQVSAQSDLGFRRRCCLKNFKMAALVASWILEWYNFSNSESQCHCDASHQVSAQFSFRTKGSGDVTWKISRWPPWRPSWILEWNNFGNFESLCHCDISHQVSAQSD